MRGNRRAQRPADEADRRRQCVVEGVAQSPAAGRVAGSGRSRRRDRLRLGSERPTRRLRRADGIEFVVARNRDGGAGSIAIDDLRIVPLPGAPAVAAAGRESAPTTRSPPSPRPSPRGDFPRAFIGEQPYWTLAGSDGGKIGALIGEDAAIEPAKGSYSIEPVVIDGGQRFDWANVAKRQIAGRRPAADPAVRWTDAGLHARHDAARRHAGRAALCRLHADQSPARPGGRSSCGLACARGRSIRPRNSCRSRAAHSPISRIDRDAGALRIIQPQDRGRPADRRAR